MPMARCSGIYRKMHIPDDPLYYEKYYFTPGRPGFPLLRHALSRAWRRWCAGTSGIPRRRAWRRWRGAQVLFYPTAIGWHPAEKAECGAAQHDAWRTIQRAHAIANGVYVAAVNRVGYEGPPERGLEFWGGSFVADPFGQVLAEASHDREEILIVECDPRRHRGSPPQLAVPARPAHRRLRAHPQAAGRLELTARLSQELRGVGPGRVVWGEIRTDVSLQ